MRIFGDITRRREGTAAAARGARTRGRAVRRAGAAPAALAFLLCVMGAPMASAADAAKDNDTLYQVSTLNALMLGDYDGSVTLGDLKKQGSIGLGTFDKLDGG